MVLITVGGGAAIHAEPLGYSANVIPIQTFDPTLWKINPKGFDQDVQKFDGRPENYRLWWNRIRDHLTGGYQPWGRLLDIVERQREQLTFRYLSSIPTVDGAVLDLRWLSQELWCFLGPRLSESPYSRRVQLAGGEERNGLELWRRLHQDNEGGAEQVALAGLRRLHRFTPCPPKINWPTTLAIGNC